VDAFPEHQKDYKLHVNKASELFTISPLQCRMHVFPELFTLFCFPYTLEKQ